MAETVIVAVGGNSLILDPKKVTVADQYEAARQTAENMIDMFQKGYNVVIVHGNGPQVGYILRRAEIAKDELHMVPLDSCVADTQGSIGYNLQMALYNEMNKKNFSRPVATVVSQVLVDANDPSFQNPTKPIGSFMEKAEADEKVANEGWDVVEDAGRGFRRVVASPKPKGIVEIDAIKDLLKANAVVIAAGGGGIPVVEEADGSLSGKEAVIDKDYAASLLAEETSADYFVISTAVEKVCINFGKPDQKAIDQMTVAEAKKLCEEGHFAPGSMLPKIEAMMKFVETTGKPGIITDPAHLAEALEGKAGTKMVP